jgi:hypothetical protein
MKRERDKEKSRRERPMCECWRLNWYGGKNVIVFSMKRERDKVRER